MGAQDLQMMLQGKDSLEVAMRFFVFMFKNLDFYFIFIYVLLKIEIKIFKNTKSVS